MIDLFTIHLYFYQQLLIILLEKIKFVNFPFFLMFSYNQINFIILYSFMLMERSLRGSHNDNVVPTSSPVFRLKIIVNVSNS